MLLKKRYYLVINLNNLDNGCWTVAENGATFDSPNININFLLRWASAIIINISSFQNITSPTWFRMSESEFLPVNVNLSLIPVRKLLITARLLILSVTLLKSLYCLDFNFLRCNFGGRGDQYSNSLWFSNLCIACLCHSAQITIFSNYREMNREQSRDWISWCYFKVNL